MHKAKVARLQAVGHRLFTNFNAGAEGVDVERIIEKILEVVPEPSYGEATTSRH